MSGDFWDTHMKNYYMICWFGRLRDKVGAHQCKLFDVQDKEKAIEFLDRLYQSPKNTHIHMEQIFMHNTITFGSPTEDSSYEQMLQEETAKAEERDSRGGSDSDVSRPF